MRGVQDRSCNAFSPVGRRWREAPDEGARKTEAYRVPSPVTPSPSATACSPHSTLLVALSLTALSSAEGSKGSPHRGEGIRDLGHCSSQE